MVRTLQCRIEELATWHPWSYVEPQIVAFVAVLEPYSRPTAAFDVDCYNVESSWLGKDKNFRLEVSWSVRTAEKARRHRATMQAKPLVELAATALALSIVHHILDLGRLDASLYGDRTDYRSTRMCCMLEISGTEYRRELARRHRQKIAQALSNPFGWDAYVVVCVFSSQGHQIRFLVSPSEGSRPMTKRQAKFLTGRAEELMDKKSRVLTQAQALLDIGLEESARSVWATAASDEERIAPILDAIGREAEAALHRVSAASCLQKSGDSSRAANLYRAALAGPLSDLVRSEVERMLSVCLKHLHRDMVDTVA